jgi:UDP-N-acetylmuramyl pentapeptide phosphotransferase/UDP-N-acetylglucosamine-1-phosphate transferase
LNGYLLAVFAIMGSTRWTTTMIVLALPIIDGLLVVFMRLRDHPEARKNPLKLLSISDKNHFHHRLLRAGYSRKMVTMMEVAIVSVVCSTAIVFSDLRKQYIAFVVGFIFLFAVFTLVFFLMIRKEKNKTFGRFLSEDPRKSVERKEAVVKVIMENENAEKEEDYDKFIY